jgi:hypothetical protein
LSADASSQNCKALQAALEVYDIRLALALGELTLEAEGSHRNCPFGF